MSGVIRSNEMDPAVAIRVRRRRWPLLFLVFIAFLLVLAGGLFAASRFFGIGLYAVSAPSQALAAPLKHGDMALVRKESPSKISLGELVGVRLSRGEESNQGLPQRLVGEVVVIDPSGNSKNFFVDSGGRIASVIPSTATGAGIGTIIDLIPYAGFPLLLLSSPGGIVTSGAFIVAFLGLLAWAFGRRRMQRIDPGGYPSTLGVAIGEPPDVRLALSDASNPGTSSVRADSDGGVVFEGLLQKRNELRMVAEWSLVGGLDSDQLHRVLSETADMIDALHVPDGLSGDANSEGTSGTPRTGSLQPNVVTKPRMIRRKTPFVPSERAFRRFAIHAVTLIALAISVVYLVWRAAFTMAALWISVPFLLLEIWSFVDLVLYAYSAWNVDPPEVFIEDGSGLSCTVLIATYNEPISILLPTVAAAASMEFATETWVLDDGNRKEVEEMVRRVGVKYVARPEHTHAKPGNLNHALESVTTDLFAVFDADHTPRPEFLSHTIGYFADPTVALVQTPQEFYNLGSFEHFGALHEESLFYRVIQPGKGRRGAAFWCGTNAVLRTSALRDVGGVSMDSIAEDFQTTIRLHRKGWKSIYHNEALAHGLAAADISQYTVQRKRWGKGAMQVIKSKDNPLLASGLTLSQRISYFYSLSAWFDSWHTLLMALVPTVVLATGQFPFRISPLLFVATFLSTFVLQQVVLKILGRGWNKLWYSLQFDMIRLSSNLVATLSLLSFKRRTRHQKFVVTKKGSLGNFRARMLTPWPLMVVALLLAASLIWGAAMVGGYVNTSLHPRIAATVTLAWTSINLVLVLAAMKRSVSSKFATERRDGYRVDVSVPVLISREGSYLTTDISMTGCNVLAHQPGDANEIELMISGVKVRATARSFDGSKGSFEFLPGQWDAMKELSMMTFHPENSDPDSDTSAEELR